MRSARSLTEGIRNPLIIDLRGFTCYDESRVRKFQTLSPLCSIVGGFVYPPFATSFRFDGRGRDKKMKVMLPTYLGDLPYYTRVTATGLTIRQDIDAFTVCANEKIIKAAISGRQEAFDVLTEMQDGKPIRINPAILVQIYLSHISHRDRGDIFDKILKRVERSVSGGADGVIISGRELGQVRKRFPEIFIAVGGIRCRGLKVRDDDQARAISFAQAFGGGADLIIVGRPIIDAPNPLDAVNYILDEIEKLQTTRGL